jgi:hypothetical protein
MNAEVCVACRRPKADHLFGYYTELRSAETAVCVNIPVTVPLEHQAQSSGALGTPERNHDCPHCGGLGEVSIYPCELCLGTGELTASGSRDLRPATTADWAQFVGGRPLMLDAALRRKVSQARADKKIGVRS